MPELNFYAVLKIFFVVEKALMNYLDLENHSNTHLHEKPPRHVKPCLEILLDLIDRGFTLEFSNNELFKSIENVRGSDYRTKRKWLRILLKHNYIKYKSSRILVYGSNPNLRGLPIIPVTTSILRPTTPRESSSNG